MESFVAEEEQFSNAEEAFYTKIRGLVVVFLFFVILLALAHLTLRYFIARSDAVFDRSDRVVHRIVCAVCTFTLTITFAVYSLLPFSIIANEVLLSFPSSVYVQWLNTELVHDLALLVHYGTKTICLIVPFAYFLLNSHGFHGRNSAFGSRLLEAVTLTGLSYILVFGTIWSFKSAISALILVLFGNSTAILHTMTPESHPISLLMNAFKTLTWSEFTFSFLIQTFAQSLTSIQLVATFIGLILLFIYMPIGLVNLTFHIVSIGFQSLPELTRKSRVEEKLFRLQMEVLCMQDDIQTAFLLSRKAPTWCETLALTLPISQAIKSNGPFTTDAVGLLDQLHSRLPYLQQEIKGLQKQLADKFTPGLKETLRRLAPIALLVLISCMLRLMESFVFFNILDLVRKLLFGEDSFKDLTPFSFWNVEKYSKISATTEFALGHKPVSAFGHVGALLQICVIQFLLCASLWGFHATPSTRFLRPRRHAVDLNRLLANVTMLLLFTSALPLQTNLLGLTSLTLPSALKLSSVYDTNLAFSKLDGQLAGVDSKNKVIICNRDSCQTDSPRPVSQQSWSLWKKFSCHFSIARIFSSHVCSSNDWENSSNPQKSVIIKEDLPPLQSPSIFTQFMATAFGSNPTLSSSTPSPSYGSVFITLLYNLCFLVTSVYVACLRLNDPILWLVSKVFTSLRYCPHVSFSDVQLHSSGAAGRHLSDYRRSLDQRNSSSR